MNSVGSLDDGCVLHVVGDVTDEVFSFLGPATQTLAKNNFYQIVIVVDEPHYRRNSHRLCTYTKVLNVAKSKNRISLWKSVYNVCLSQINNNDFEKVHVHGMVPLVIATLAIRLSNKNIPIIYSPHGSRSLGSFKLLGKFLILFLRSSKNISIVTVPSEKYDLNNAELVESPINENFFSVSKDECSSPLIVSGGRQNNKMSFQIFSQLAVLLSGEELGARFFWLGKVSASMDSQLSAADIKVLDCETEKDCAQSLAQGWIYVAPWQTRGFPLFLAQAMAVGLPCVAFDCDQHRSLIDQGKTGFLCTSEHEMIKTIASLVDSKNLRTKIGNAARYSVSERLNSLKFSRKLLNAYLIKK